jgi:hypothetical protein
MRGARPAPTQDPEAPSLIGQSLPVAILSLSWAALVSKSHSELQVW